jgi:hypothetical protein
MQLSDALIQEQISQQIGAGERRGHPRFACDHPAYITSSLNPQPVAIRIRNISKGGLGLRVPTFLPLDSEIDVHLKQSVAHAVVRYCVRVGSEFHAGVAVGKIEPKS